MGSATLLNVEELLLPVPGDDPAGSSVSYNTREQLDDKRKEINPEDYAPDDPMRPENPKRADWDGIIQQTQTTLKESSKDLLIAARLMEALTKKHGFAGLRDGLRLLRSLVETCWDRLYPLIEDNDIEVRAGPFNWLDDTDRGARFPHTLRSVPIFVGSTQSFCWMQWRQVQDGKGAEIKEEFDSAVLSATREHCQTLAEDIDEALTELRALQQLLAPQLQQYAPGFTALTPALGDCRTLVQQVLAKKAPPPTEAEEMVVNEQGEMVRTRPAASSREEIYSQLVRAADQLRLLEPHSPVPYLILKAVDLGTMPFPQLMQRLIRESNVLEELNRELGIASETPQ